jgi:glycosyltransferase involved in cell wall biosynthesis
MKVVHWVQDLIRGGTEGQCARTAMGLAGRGWEQRVVVFRRAGFFLDDVEAACGRCEVADIRHAARWATWREIRRLARWLRESGADLLHTWDADAAVFGQWAARLAGIPLVTSRRDLGGIYPRWKTAALHLADSQARRVVANAEAIADHFGRGRRMRGKIRVIPNIVDIDERDREAMAWGGRGEVGERRPGERRMVIVNRLDPEKRTELLIEALPLVRKQHPGAVLWVIGDGREKAKLERVAAECGVAEAVRFWGERTDIAGLLGCVDAGALVPVGNEGRSNSILEYMAAGLPVLASDCGGNRELVEDGRTGRLIGREATPEETAVAWCDLLDDEALVAAWGREGRHRAEQWRPDAVLPLFEQLYREVAELGGRVREAP